jgi:hypothetical protein
MVDDGREMLRDGREEHSHVTCHVILKCFSSFSLTPEPSNFQILK